MEPKGLSWGLSESDWVCGSRPVLGVREAPAMAVFHALHLSPAPSWPAQGPASEQLPTQAVSDDPTSRAANHIVPL